MPYLEVTTNVSNIFEVFRNNRECLNHSYNAPIILSSGPGDKAADPAIYHPLSDVRHASQTTFHSPTQPNKQILHAFPTDQSGNIPGMTVLGRFAGMFEVDFILPVSFSFNFPH